MTILGLMQEVFPLAKLHIELDGCQADLVGEDNVRFWLKDVSDETMKDICKRFMNIIYDIPNAHILVKSDYIDTDSTQENEWDEIPENVLCGALKVSDILDDATTHGLSFKYENGKYYIKPNECDPN